MKASELESRLRELREKYGDLVVLACSHEDEIKHINVLDEHGCIYGTYHDGKKPTEIFMES
ncbi:hypothetical protein FIU93_22960 [Labrenzia sp. THAF35]|uniref:hypothetical protein n=1 Tax=Labrenzia sp. THAF35 TaxID=2587854 RepID=UPI0012691A29|nr:hypothetical protein [Labrenzia sp. THAF35]QFT69663.1 hypothetical protein FIU93_22960 [Labrenzia sp. THAF35]